MIPGKLSFRQLDLADLPALLQLQETIRQCLPSPDLYQFEDESYYARLFAGRGAGFGAFDNGAMAAYGIIAFPGAHPENLCHEVPHLALDTAEVAHLDGSAVHPAWRGLSIQQQLSALRIAYGAGKGARHFLLTVAPMNPYSLRNHLNAGGFSVRAIKQKYGGLWRLILHRALDRQAPASVDQRECCRLDDVEAHQRLLAAGFSGTRLVSREDVWYLAYEAYQTKAV